MKPAGFIEAFLETAAATPQQTALELIDLPEGDVSRAWSYGRLLSLMERYRGGFVALGVQPGDPVMLHLPSGPDLIACAYALTSLQAVFAPVSSHLTPFELDALINDFAPEIIVSETATADQGGQRRLLSLDRLPDARSSLEPPPDSAIVSCNYTYKGLGYPLGALHRYESYNWCIQGMQDAFRDAVGMTHLVGLPIYPIYGLATGVLGPLSSRCRVLLTNRIFEGSLIEMLERHQVAFACMVPMLLRKLAQNARRLVEEGHAFRLHPNLQIMSGGSYLDEETAASVKASAGVDVYQGYGLTETLIVSATCRAGDRPGSLGMPLASQTHVVVRDAGGVEVAPGRAGEIAVQSRSLLAGYRNRPEETSRLLRDGWFYTGDIGFKDAEGFLHFIARRSAITKVASQMADLVEVENVLRTLPGIADARVTVAVRPEIGEALCASIILNDGATVTERELKRACKQLLSPHKTPREFRFVKAGAERRAR